MAKRTSPAKKLILILALLLLFATHFISPPAGLSQAGFQVLGILLGAILLFLSWGTGWTSMLIICALMTVPGVTVSQVTQATFGNNTAVFLLFCFMLSACLIKSGVAKRIAIWFITNKLAQKSPWWTIAMYFAAAYVLDFCLSSAVCIMILLPILTEIFESIGLKKEAKTGLASALLLGSVLVAQLANGANPISHAVTLQGFSFYESYTGEAMSFFTYSAVCTPITILCAVVFYLVVRFLWKPDISALKNVDYHSLSEECGTISKREKWSLWIYILCVIFWLLPGLSKQFWPSIYPMLSKINNCYPPLIALFLMNFIHVDGEKILEWDDAVKAVNWPSFMFIATIMGLGTFIGNQDIGLSAWMSGALAPAFTNISPLMFILIMVLLVNTLTNFCSNSVALSVVFAIAMPLSMTVYDGRVSPMVVAILVTNAALNGWATAPATPTAAVAYASGWGNDKLILKWGLLMMVVNTIISITLGIPLVNLFS